MKPYDAAWNPHYNFEDPRNLAEIEKRDAYNKAFHTVYQAGGQGGSPSFLQAQDYLLQCERQELGGRDGYDFGVIVEKDWGSNEVISFKHENGQDTCIKKITVKPNNMLSLQAHEGRKEEWMVTDGTLTLIMNAKMFEVSDTGVFDITDETVRQPVKDPAIARLDGEHWSIILPKGSVHCMVNASNAPVTVIETQTGITREADNNRFADQIRGQQTGRATIPLPSELHYQSALLYWRIEAALAGKPETGWKVSYRPQRA